MASLSSCVTRLKPASAVYDAHSGLYAESRDGEEDSDRSPQSRSQRTARIRAGAPVDEEEGVGEKKVVDEHRKRHCHQPLLSLRTLLIKPSPL
eukprot:599676-Rhodomonas_salina.1